MNDNSSAITNFINEVLRSKLADIADIAATYMSFIKQYGIEESVMSRIYDISSTTIREIRSDDDNKSEL